MCTELMVGRGREGEGGRGKEEGGREGGRGREGGKEEVG